MFIFSYLLSEDNFTEMPKPAQKIQEWCAQQEYSVFSVICLFE